MLGTGSITALTRLGFAARGVMYLVIGYLALRSGRNEDGSGALAHLSDGSAQPLLFAMALGFFAYGVWRLSEAAFDTEGHGDDAKGWAVRGGGAVSGFIHLGLAMLALKLGSGGAETGGGARQSTADALSFPGGELAVALVGAALGVVGAWQLMKAVKGDFLRHLDDKIARTAWCEWLGRGGYAARGIVFLVMGWFLLQAGLGSNASKAAGMGDALASLPDTLRTAVAAGLFLFGLFSLVEGRYRRINDPRVLDRLKRAMPG